MASWMKESCSPMCVCLHVSKVNQINGSIVGQIKEDENVVFTYINVYVCVCMSDGP